MSTWNIYHKDGSKLTDVNGEQITVHGLEYSDSWMGECFLTISFKHEVPISFQIGDYIVYRGERFELNYEPGKDKQARPDTYGEGFVYDSVKFNALQDELSRAEFLDVVLNDNELHYTALPKFPFYVQTLDDLLDRIQANLDEQIGKGLWKIYSRNMERSVQRGCLASDWLSMYGEGTSDNVIESMSITVDSQTCWQALALVNEKWNINFIVRGRNVYVGTTGIQAKHIFKYGLGNGLYEIKQNADSDQSVITRLRAYGSEKNLPSHYYADLGVKYVANITKVVEASTYVELELDLDYIETYFKNKRKYVVSGESQEQSSGWVLQVTFDFQTIVTGYVAQINNSSKCRFHSELKGAQVDTGDEESKEKLDAFIAQVKAGNTKMYITSGLNKKTVPSSMKEYAENLPNNMSINRLMLPGFPHVSLSDFYESLTDEEKKYVNPTGKQHRFSTDPHRPYIDSINIDQIGLRSASQFFDTDDKTNGIIEIYPTIEEMVIGGVRVDEIDEGIAPDDDGRYDDDPGPKNVDIYLSKAVDFDIKDLADNDFSISMKDGMCGGRTFKVASSTKVDGRWRLTIERIKDDALELWFPYKDYPIRKGDHFVLTGITLPDSYVKAASLKLLKYAIALLEKNDYTRYVYQPKVDELFMARQHDRAKEDTTGVIKSLHDTLKAGDLMEFEDTDLRIGGVISIDQLTIKEEDGKIPTYEITLREDKEVGTIQKIQQQISSLQSGNGGTGAGLTTTQVKNQVATEGSKHFISKVNDDTANGKITFIKGLIAKGLADLMMGAKFGNNAMITKLGEAVFSAIKSLDYDNAAEQGFSVEKEKNGKYHAFVTNLTIWGKAIFHELEVRKLSYSGGNIYLSGAGSKLIKVVPVKKLVSNGVTTWVKTTEDDAERVGWKCYLLADNGTTATMNDWQEGDQARCQTMGEIVSGGTYQNASNKSYWRTIPNGGVSTQNEKIYGTKTETYLDEDGNEQTKEVQVELYDGQAFAWIVVGKHCNDIDGYDDEFSVGYNGSNPAPLETRDIPAEGDTIVLDGNRHRDGNNQEYDKTDRQNVIILETTGEYAPRIACYANITEYKHTITKSVNGSDKEVSLSVFETSPKGGTKINSSRFEWISEDGSTINIINYRGDWSEDYTYRKNDQVNHNNAVWVCVANSGVDVSEEPSDSSKQWKKVLSGGKGEKGDKGDKGENAIRLALTNENSSVSCDKNGNPLGTVQGTIAILYDGAVAANADRVTYSIVSYDGLSVMPEINAGGAIDNIEIRGGNTSLKASINIKAVYENQAYYATYTITKVLAGSDGTPAIIYWIEPSATAIKVDSDGNANPSTITCKQYKQVGAESPVAGDKKIYYRHNAMDSTLWNEYTEAINPATNVDAYEFVLADKTPSNSSAIIYDRESIPVIKDGQNGNDGLSGNGIVPVYARSKDNPTPPTSTDKNNLDNGWSLAIPSVADVKNVSYSDSSWTDYNDGSYTWKKSPTTAANSTSWCLVTFTTTQANQTVMFVIKSFSEKKYDYIFLSEIDASNVPSKPGFAGASRAVSGNGIELSITDVVATAGTHTVYICYGKDASGDYNGDYGLFRIESMAGIPLWQSNGKEVFSREDNGTIKSKIESWSEPFKVTGENGEDAVSYTVTLTRGSNGITQGLYVGVTRYIGTACTTGTIIDFGMSCKAYTDGTLAEGLTNRLQTEDNYIDFAAFPKAKSFTVELLDKNGNKVATGNYSSGDDAISILVEDAPLVFDTDDNGTVPADDTKTAKVKVMRGNANVTNDCNQESSRNDLSSNCQCDVTKDKDNECISVSVQGRGIVKNDVIVDGVNQGKVSTTSGYAVAQFVYDSVVYFAQVPFSVNVAKFTGVVAFNNKQYESKFTEISKKFGQELADAESRITQTAREISLSVSEKTIGRRNLLVGSAARRQGEGWTFMSGGYYNGLPCDSIEINSGHEGVNAIHCRTKQTGTNSYYMCGFRWIGTYSQQGNIKLKKGKSYTLSFWAKAYNSGYVNFISELIWQGSATDNSRPAGYTGPKGFLTTQQATKNNTWTQFKVNIEVPSSASYEYVEVNIFARATNYTLQDAYICKPMLEEGDYNGWTLSEQDYDYVGGNLLDNTRTLTVGGNLNDVGESTIISQGYGYDSAVAHADNSSGSSYKEILRWRTTSGGNMSFQKGKDYLLSFLASGSGRMTCYLYCSANNTSSIYSENNQGNVTNNAADGASNFTLSSGWKRYWVHFRVLTDSPLPTDILMRAVIGTNVYVAQPKLEEGATMTEYTERKSDLVDKASLKAAGIEITSNQVTLYGNQVHVKKNKTDANDTVLIDTDTGQVSAGLINADEVVAKGIQAKNLEATNLNVTGSSKFGIWEIRKDEDFGEMIQARGDLQLPSGYTAQGSGVQYLPLYIRGGLANANYFRVGVSCTEFSYSYNGRDFCGVWTGKAADYVCGSVANTAFNTPTEYGYDESYHPAEYIYTTKSLPNDPALAINVVKTNGSDDGERTAIQTNAAIRGVLAPNAISINYTRTIPNGFGVVICTNGSEMTLTLPANPLEGQTLIIIQGSDKRVYIVPSGDEVIYCGGQTRDKNNKFFSGTIGQFNIFVFIRGNWQLQFMNNRP